MIVLNRVVFGETSPVNSRAHLPTQGKDKHFLLVDKCKLQSKFQSGKNILLFSLLTRLDESNLHRACLIGQGTHIWATVAEGIRGWLVDSVWRLPFFQRGGGLVSPAVPQCHTSQGLPGAPIKWPFWAHSEQLDPSCISQHKLFGVLIMLQGMYTVYLLLLKNT